MHVSIVDKYNEFMLSPVNHGERKGMEALRRPCACAKSNLDSLDCPRHGFGAPEPEEVIPVLPLNGWRARNLAEKLLGSRDAGLWTLGTAKLVKVADLLELPSWDDPNAAYLSTFGLRSVVAIEVVAVNSGYGPYIAVTQWTKGEHAYWNQVFDQLQDLRKSGDVEMADEFEGTHGLI